MPVENAICRGRTPRPARAHGRIPVAVAGCIPYALRSPLRLRRRHGILVIELFARHESEARVVLIIGTATRQARR